MGIAMHAPPTARTLLSPSLTYATLSLTALPVSCLAIGPKQRIHLRLKRLLHDALHHRLQRVSTSLTTAYNCLCCLRAMVCLL